MWKKGFGYNQNCHDFLENHPRNKIFNEFPHTSQRFTPRIAEFYKKHYKFPNSERLCNFNPKSTLEIEGKGKKKAGNSRPYRWEGHHMIPGSAFYMKFKGPTGSSTQVFTDSQYQLLLMSNYDVNNGHNLIPLPANGRDSFQFIHSLLQHPSDHPKYTTKVQNDMKKISEKLKKIEVLAKNHPDIKVDIAKNLYKLEDFLGDFIVTLSRKVIGNALPGAKKEKLTEEEESVLKYKTAGKTKL